MHPAVAFALADERLSMAVFEGDLLELSPLELQAQIRLLKQRVHHATRLLTAAHRARKRQSRGQRG